MTGTSKREICRPGQRVTGVDEVNGVGGVDHLWLAFSKDKYIYIYISNSGQTPAKGRTSRGTGGKMVVFAEMIAHISSG